MLIAFLRPRWHRVSVEIDLDTGFAKQVVFFNDASWRIKLWGRRRLHVDDFARINDLRNVRNGCLRRN